LRARQAVGRSAGWLFGGRRDAAGRRGRWGRRPAYGAGRGGPGVGRRPRGRLAGGTRGPAGSPDPAARLPVPACPPLDRTRGTAPRLLVHALGMRPHGETGAETVTEQLEESFYSLLAVVQEGVRWPVSGHQPGLLMLMSRSADITGAEPIDPAKAMLHGFVR